MSNKLPGEMLQSNLTRSGTNLTFDNDLLHLDVAARRVGIGTVTPDQALAVEGSARLDDIVVQGTTLSATAGNITLTPGLGSNVVIDSGLANSLAFFGPANEIQGSALLYFDGVSLVVDTTTTIADTTFTPGQILSDQALQITTLSGDITLAPGGGGAVVIPNLTISNLPVNRLLYSDPTGVMRTAAAFAFDDVTSTATLIGTLNVDDVTIEDNSISSLSATPLTIASQNIEINALGGDITIDNAYATGVFYADPLKALSTSAALTFDNTNGILYANNVTTTGVVVAPTFRTNNLEIAGNDIYSMDTGDIVTVYGSATNNVLKTGDTMSGFLTLHADPDLAFHAATKNYVDQVAQGLLRVKEGVNVATTDALDTLSGGAVVYDNGVSGVGATLTLTNPLTTIDDFLLTAGDRVLVKDEANAAHNGIYIYTSSTVFTRDTLNDEFDEVERADFVFVISGTLAGGTGWVQTNTVDIIGTDDIVWAQFSGQSEYIGVDGITVDGNEISLTYPPSALSSADTTVIRDGSGNFAANVITGALSGNASTATALQTPRTINGVSFNGTANITITANTTNTLTRGSFLTGANFNGSAATTWAVDATALNTASKVVARDASGTFDIGGIDFDTTPPAGAVARLRWNDTDGTLEVGLKGGTSTLQIGQETMVRVLNITGATIANGATVYAHSAAGLTGRIRVQLAVGNGTIDDMRVLGVATEDILDGQEGFITVLGSVRDFDTTGTSVGETWADGDALYLHPTIPGAMTNTIPPAPSAKMHIGMVIKADALQGTIFVSVQHAGHLSEISDANIVTPTDRQALVYNGTQSYWENSTLTKSDVGLGNVTNDAQLKIASNLSDLNNAATARTNLGLSTGATATVTTSSTDTTAGRLLKVGDFGLGAAAPDLLVLDANTILTSGFYATTTGSTNLPFATGILEVVVRASSRIVQKFYLSSGSASDGRMWLRAKFDSTWTPWSLVFDHNAILGTVSQSSGVPTGAIIERGSNANGEYVRFADGTQICQFLLASTSVSAETIWTFPAAFSSTSYLNIFGQVNTSNTTTNYTLQMNNPAPTQCGFMTYSHTTAGVIARTNAGARVTAVGRWF